MPEDCGHSSTTALAQTVHHTITGRSVSGKVFPKAGKFFPNANEAATAGALAGHGSFADHQGGR
jgi:hypothetical protein